MMTTGDVPMLLNYVIALALNSWVIGLSYYYRIQPKKLKNGATKKAKTVISEDKYKKQ